MTLAQRIESFSELGYTLRNILDGRATRHGKVLAALIDNQQTINPWFTPENVRMAVQAIAEKLTESNLRKWTGNYPGLNEEYESLNAGVIMAGNIPLAGFHDFLSVLISGNRLIARNSSKDAELIKGISDILCSLNSEFRKRILFTDGRLSGFDVVIATGSNNSSRYFEYYFERFPHIIRKNRNSVAVIEGDESDASLRDLGKDIFSYFGLGCRNVSKIYLPEGFEFQRMIGNWSSFSGIINHAKYANNYEYNKAVYLVNRDKFIDTGFLLLRENEGLSSPVAVIYFQHYNSIDEAYLEIELQSENIQCIISKNDIPFGQAQSPELWDYSDKIDTIDFLLKKKITGIL